MKAIFSLLATSVFSVGVAQNITQMEFFVDVDPGAGNATTIAGFTQGPNVSSFSVSLPLDLQSGLHQLGIRTKDADGKWSLTNFRNIYVRHAEPAPIVGFEYFWDVDQGFGANSYVAFDAGGMNLSGIDEMVDVPANLSLGSHVLLVRSVDASGKYTLTNYSVPVSVEPLATNDPDRLSIGFYPNPTQSELHLHNPENKEIRAMVYDVSGRKMFDGKFSSDGVIASSDWASGLYSVLIITKGNQIFTTKILKQ